MREHKREKDQMLPLRQWLNIIFMLGAVVGVCLYFFADQQVGTIVILGAMVFKMIECVLRFVK